MSEILHTYHPTQDGEQGIHLLTTHDHAEACTMLQAAKLQQALEDILCWSATVVALIEQGHGKQSIYRELCNIFSRGTLALIEAKKGQTP